MASGSDYAHATERLPPAYLRGAVGSVRRIQMQEQDGVLRNACGKALFPLPFRCRIIHAEDGDFTTCRLLLGIVESGHCAMADSTPHTQLVYHGFFPRSFSRLSSTAFFAFFFLTFFSPFLSRLSFVVVYP